MKKNMVYFVLYIVLLTELLVVISERDELQEAENQIRDQMIVTIAKIYKKPVYISIPEKKSTYSIQSKIPKKVIFTPISLYSDAEKNNIKYFINIEKYSKKPPNWPKEGINNHTKSKNYSISIKNGNAVFNVRLSRMGTYKFNVYCEVERVLPDYLPERLLKFLKEKIGDTNLNQKSKKETFVIKAVGGLKKKKATISLLYKDFNSNQLLSILKK